MIKGIANLFNGHLLFGNSMFGPDDSAKTTLATNLDELEVLLNQSPLTRQLDHLPTLVPQLPTLVLVGACLFKVSPRGNGVRSCSISVVHISINLNKKL